MNIYLFGQKEDERLYISSADFNFDSIKNYELAIRLKDKIAINKVKHILNLYYKYNIDTVYAKLGSRNIINQSYLVRLPISCIGRWKEYQLSLL